MDGKMDHPQEQDVGDLPIGPLAAAPDGEQPPDDQGPDAADPCDPANGEAGPEASSHVVDASPMGHPAAQSMEPEEPGGTADKPAWFDKLDDLAKQQQRLSDMFDDKLRYDASREEIIDKLHREIQDYRNDMLGKIMLPVLKDLISLDNEVIKFVKDRGDINRFPPEKQDWTELLRQVAMFHDDIVEILDRYGTVAFEEESETFNPRTQRSLDTRPTESQDRNRTIAERIRPGFRWGDQVIRNEEVIVYKYQAPQKESPATE